MITKENLTLGRKIKDKLNSRGAKLDSFAETIIAEMIGDALNVGEEE